MAAVLSLTAFTMYYINFQSLLLPFSWLRHNFKKYQNFFFHVFLKGTSNFNLLLAFRSDDLMACL